MTNLHYICVSLLIGSSMLFLFTYLQHQEYLGEGLRYATPVAAVTSSILPELSEESVGHTATSSGFAITEERGMAIMVILSALICALVIRLVVNEKKRKGPVTMQEPLIATSIMLAITFVATAAKQGMF